MGEKIRTRVGVLPLSGVGRDTRERIAQARISVAREQSTEITAELESILRAEESVIQVKKVVGEIREYMKSVMFDTSLTPEQRVAKIIAYAQPKIKALERVKTDFTGSISHPVRLRSNEIITNIRENDRQITQASNYTGAKAEVVEAHRRRFNNKRGIWQVLLKIGALLK